MQQFQTITATFKPRNLSTLTPEAHAYVGKEGKFQAAWEIEDEPYAGEWAMTVTGPPPLPPFAWVPSGDLIEPENHMDLEQAIKNLSAHDCVLDHVADPSKYALRTPAPWQVYFLGDEDGVKWVSEGETWQEAVRQAEARGFAPLG